MLRAGIVLVDVGDLDRCEACVDHARFVSAFDEAVVLQDHTHQVFDDLPPDTCVALRRKLSQISPGGDAKWVRGGTLHL